MKKIYLSLLAVLFIIYISKSQSYTLTVNDAYGSGIYTEGDTVHVWGRAIMEDSIFSHWTGNGIQGLLDGNEWHNRLYIPSNTLVENVSITAHYTTIPSETQMGVDSFYLFGKTATGEIIDTFKTIHYGIPPNPKALLFLMHGTGGSGQSFFNKYERYQLVKDLIHDGFAIISVDANETTLGDINGDGGIRWATGNAGNADETNNIDIANMAFTRDSVLEKFSMAATIPTFSIGMSNGANFSDICASSLGYVAAAHITAKGKSDTYTRSDIIPIIWIAAENDHQEFANNDLAFQHFEDAQATQNSSVFHWFRRSPAYPQRFFRSLKNISLNKSAEIYNALDIQGHLDENNRLVALETDDFFLEFMEDNNNFGLNDAKAKSIRTELLCINADHVLHSDYDKRIIDFFNQSLLPTSLTQIPVDKPNLLIAPNPFSQFTRIVFDNPEHTSHDFSLFDVNGKRVKQISNIHEEEVIVQRENLAKGLYFFQIRTDNSMQTGRLLIQ